MWHGAEQTCVHPSRTFMHVEAQVGTGSVHAVRVRRVPEGKNGADLAVSSCLPHGQWVTTFGERGQGAGVREGTWQGFLQW